jgi:hypothetical protein
VLLLGLDDCCVRRPVVKFMCVVAHLLAELELLQDRIPPLSDVEALQVRCMGSFLCLWPVHCVGQPVRVIIGC